MTLIRCTAKLLREMGLDLRDLRDETPPSLLGQWHANLIYINRRRTLLFVNDRTLFNFILPDLSRPEIRRVSDHFRVMLSCALIEEGIPEDIRSRILSEHDEITFGKSSDRSVLGSSNDIAFHYKYRILEEGGIWSWKVPGIIRELNRMPMQAIEHTFPIEELESVCAVPPNTGSQPDGPAAPR